jgi:hypothetical protein
VIDNHSHLEGLSNVSLLSQNLTRGHGQGRQPSKSSLSRRVCNCSVNSTIHGGGSGGVGYTMKSTTSASSRST